MNVSTSGQSSKFLVRNVVAVLENSQDNEDFDQTYKPPLEVELQIIDGA